MKEKRGKFWFGWRGGLCLSGFERERKKEDESFGLSEVCLGGGEIE